MNFSCYFLTIIVNYGEFFNGIAFLFMLEMHMSMNKIYKGLGLLGGIALCGGIYFWWSKEDILPMEFRTDFIELGDFTKSVLSTGTLEPEELVDVGARVTGEIVEFGVDEKGKRVDYGTEVRAGQLLARIDDTIVELDIKSKEASVAQAKASIAKSKASVLQAKANVTLAKANKSKADNDLARAKSLGVGEALSAMSYDDYVARAGTTTASLEAAKASFVSAEASVEQADASLLSAEALLARELRNRDYTEIKTPVDGTIIVRQVNVGQTVVSSMSASTLFLVARDLKKMQIWASVNEADVAKVRAGQPVKFSVDALPNRSFEGVVNKVRLNATMSSNVVTYIVEIDVDNSNRILMPYMSANVEFIVKVEKDVLLVPDAALSFSPPSRYVAEQYKDILATKGEIISLGREGKARGKDASAARAGGKAARDGDKAARDGKGPRAASVKSGIVWMRSMNSAPENIVPDSSLIYPVSVFVHESDGARSWVTLPEGSALEDGAELVIGMTRPTKADVDEKKGGMMSMKRGKRRERGTGEEAGVKSSDASKKSKDDAPKGRGKGGQAGGGGGGR